MPQHTLDEFLRNQGSSGTSFDSLPPIGASQPARPIRTQPARGGRTTGRERADLRQQSRDTGTSFDDLMNFLQQQRGGGESRGIVDQAVDAGLSLGGIRESRRNFDPDGFAGENFFRSEDDRLQRIADSPVNREATAQTEGQQAENSRTEQSQEPFVQLPEQNQLFNAPVTSGIDPLVEQLVQTSQEQQAPVEQVAPAQEVPQQTSVQDLIQSGQQALELPGGGDALNQQLAQSLAEVQGGQTPGGQFLESAGSAIENIVEPFRTVGDVASRFNSALFGGPDEAAIAQLAARDAQLGQPQPEQGLSQQLTESDPSFAQAGFPNAIQTGGQSVDIGGVPSELEQGQAEAEFRNFQAQEAFKREQEEQLLERLRLQQALQQALQEPSLGSALPISQ